MIGFVLSFLTGVVTVQQFSTLPDAKWLMLSLLSVVIFLWLRFWYGLIFVFGLLWAILFATMELADRLPKSLEGISILIKGYIPDLPKQNEKLSRFDFIVTDAPEQLPKKIKLSWYFPDHSIKAAQQWSFSVKLKRPHSTLNPGGFDYERWLFEEGVGATGYILSYPRPMRLDSKPAWTSIIQLRQTIAVRLDQMGINPAALSRIKALTFGDATSISQPLWEIFRKSGATHLVVISGSHISLIAGVVYLIVMRLWAWTGLLNWSPQKVAALSALIAAIFYALLAGFSVPTLRALVMVIVVMAAIILQRNDRPFHTLALALFVILLFDPLAVLSVGFWLSFSAVGIIIYCIAGRLTKSGYVWSMIKINWATSVALAPLVLWFFQQVSLISPIANIIAVPIISLLVVPLSLLGILALFISPFLVEAVLYPVEQTLQAVCWFLTKLTAIPFAAINHPAPSLLALCFAVIGILLLLAPKGIPARWLGLVLFLPLVFANKKHLSRGEFALTLLGAGQGLATVVETTEHVLVFDTGAKVASDSDIGKTRLLPFLRYRDIDKLDRLIISHGDNDHIGGANSLFQNLPPDKLITSVPKQLGRLLSHSLSGWAIMGLGSSHIHPTFPALDTIPLR